jgi:hypothetical protein
LVCAMADASVEIIKNSFKDRVPAKKDRSHLRVVK